MSKIQMKTGETVAEIFHNFIMTRKTKGLSDKTVSSYQSHFKSMKNHLNIDMPRYKNEETIKEIYSIQTKSWSGF